MLKRKTIKTDRKGPDRELTRRPLRPKNCKLCSVTLDYQDTGRLSKYTSERGKILPRRITGTCSPCQRKLSRVIKRARTVALMPYIAVEA